MKLKTTKFVWRAKSESEDIPTIVLRYRRHHLLNTFQLPAETNRKLNIMAEFAAKGAERANEGFGKAQNEAAKVMGQTYPATTQVAKDFNLHLIEITQKNMNAAFDLARQLASVKTPSEFIELSSAHVRKQFEAFAEQTQQITTLAQKVSDQAGQQFQKEAAESVKKN